MPADKAGAMVAGWERVLETIHLCKLPKGGVSVQREFWLGFYL